MTRVKKQWFLVNKENEIRVRVVNEFKVLLSPTRGWRPNISGLSFARLETMEVPRLEKPFSKREVMEALKGFCGDKAPRSEGFFEGGRHGGFLGSFMTITKF